MIIVLACPSKTTLRMRTMFAASQAKKNMGERILLMGTSSQTETMVSYLERSPIKRRLVMEPNCRTTAEMALLASSHVLDTDGEVAIVTSTVHGERAKMLFDESLQRECRLITVERSGVHYDETLRERKKIETFLIHRAILAQ